MDSREGIKLNFINNCVDENEVRVVIFQKNAADSSGKAVVAWKVIPGRMGQSKEFFFPFDIYAGVIDGSGNATVLAEALPGQLFYAGNTGTGLMLEAAGEASRRTEIQVKNNLAVGNVDVCIYRDDRLLAIEPAIAPGQNAVFIFEPTLWIGAAGEVEEGKIISEAQLGGIDTEISLMGISSADIVMANDNDSTYNFFLKNIKF